MEGLKKIMFGIALMIFGFVSCYVGALTSWMLAQIIGPILPVVGIAFALVGYFLED